MSGDHSRSKENTKYYQKSSQRISFQNLRSFCHQQEGQVLISKVLSFFASLSPSVRLVGFFFSLSPPSTIKYTFLGEKTEKAVERPAFKMACGAQGMDQSWS